ncbi:MAG TPA: hypothetical protein VFT84_16105 [Gemmatimonadales bacterium]|nr:hypothetical protein [Gemmatimonadales bacterium]
MHPDARSLRWLRRLASAAAILAAAAPLRAQVGSVGNPRVLTLSAVKPGTLTVGVLSGMVQNMASVQDNALNTWPTPVVIVTQWNVNPGQTNTVNLMAYFTTPAQALVGGAVQIPSSRVRGRMTTGLPVAFTAFTQNAVGGIGTVGGSLRLFSQAITGINKNSSRTDNLDLQLDLVGTALAPGTYTGTLNIRAVTQ